MRRTKIVITLDEDALAGIDRLVAGGAFADRNEAIEAAIHDRVARLRRSRLALECSKLDRREEEAMVEERYVGETKWPEY